MTQFENVLETILEEYARRDSEGEFDTWEETDAFVREKAGVLLTYAKEEPVSEELEEASKEWLRPQLDKSYANYGETKMMELTHFDGYAMLYAVEFGAQWQKQQDQSTIELAEDHAMLAGMEKMKEQMMANGVDGVVHHFEKCEVASVHYNDPTGVPMAYFTSPEGLSAGDKVKIIVIKED